MLEMKGSLEACIRCCYDITGLETDIEFLEDVVEVYEKFCFTYRVAMEKPFNQESFVQKYQLNFSTGKRHKLAKIKEENSSFSLNRLFDIKLINSKNSE